MTAAQPASPQHFEDFKAEYAEKTKKAEAYAAAQGFTLRNLSIYLPGSDETTCFNADITKDGKRIGHARNDGNGGSTFIDIPGNAYDRELLEIWADTLVEAESDRKEVAKAEAGAKRWAKRKGYKAIAMKWNGAELSYVGSPSLSQLAVYLRGKGMQGYTSVAL